jgi:hypothetical protein
MTAALICLADHRRRRQLDLLARQVAEIGIAVGWLREACELLYGGNRGPSAA